jgi:hypothetical protein
MDYANFFGKLTENIPSHRMNEPHQLTAEEEAEIEAKDRVFKDLTCELTFQGALEASNKEREVQSTTLDIALTYGETVGTT